MTLISGTKVRGRGYRDGYGSGYKYGYQLGKREAIVSRELQIPSRRSLKLLYVTSGLWSYRPLDQGIEEALNELAAEVKAVTPNEDIPLLAAQFQPDLLISLNSVQCMNPLYADKVREMGIKTAVWFTDDPYYIDVTLQLAPHYDYVFTLESSCVPLYREVGCSQVYHLPLAAPTGIYRPLRTDTSHRRDFCFIGSAFTNRLQFFEEMADYLVDKNFLISGYWWEKFSRYSELSPKMRAGSWMSPEETALVYNSSKIVINFHRSIDEETNQNRSLVPAHSINPRTFEIAACGVLQLSDVRLDLPSSYTPGVEMATYSSPSELIELLEYYLVNEEERERMALRALERTIREHTYYRRLAQLLETIFGI